MYIGRSHIGASILGDQHLPANNQAIADAVWAHSDAIQIEQRLTEAWGRLGLDPSKPLISGQTEISFGAIVMALSGDQTSSTLTRQ
jgi:hypothetical protein